MSWVKEQRQDWVLTITVVASLIIQKVNQMTQIQESSGKLMLSVVNSMIDMAQIQAGNLLIIIKPFALAVFESEI